MKILYTIVLAGLLLAVTGLATASEANIRCPQIAAKEIADASAVLSYLKNFDQDEIPSAPQTTLLTSEDLVIFGMEGADLLSDDQTFSFKVSLEGITSHAGDAVYLVQIAKQGCVVELVQILSAE